MLEKKPKRNIQVKIKHRRAKVHGGAWKIAYADFVTAMMAFFLLMWLVGTLDSSGLGMIAEYFKTPLKIVLSGEYKMLGESALIVHGGGRDLTISNKDQTIKSVAHPQETLNLKNAKTLIEIEELSKMLILKKQVDELIDSNQKISPFKNQLKTDITSAGLRIQILDESKRSMFALSKAEIETTAREILKELAPTLNQLPNKISLAGHTDARPFLNGSRTYSNWELSVARALEARRVLIEGGLNEERILRVIGLSSSVLLDDQDPLNPINRRISILVLNKQAEEAAVKEDSMPSMEVKDSVKTLTTGSENSPAVKVQ